MLYMNLSSIALKRLRERASKEQPSPSSSRISSNAKKTSPVVNKSHSVSPTTTSSSNRMLVNEKKIKKSEASKPSAGTYYLDEIFKTTVNMEMHQKNMNMEMHQKTKPHSSTNHVDLNMVDDLESSNDSVTSIKEERRTSKARRPLSFSSTLQKVDQKLIGKKERPRVGSPNVKKQFGRSKSDPSMSGTTKNSEEESSSSVNTKPASLHVQKLVDKGFAKVKAKSSVEQVSHPTNRISLASNKLNRPVTSSSKLPSSGRHNELPDKLKGKSIRQISVNKSPLTSPVFESVSDTTTTTGSPAITASKFYSSKVSNPGKIKVNIKSNPKSVPVPSKTEKHSTSSPNYSILKKKEVVLTGTSVKLYNVWCSMCMCIYYVYII